MKPVFGLFVALGLASFVILRANGQTPVCSTPSPTRAFGQALVELEKQYLRQRAGARLDEDVTDVAIKAHVMQFSDGRRPVTNAQLDTCLVYLNRLFLPAGIRFHWDGDVDLITSDQFASVDTYDEVNEIRRLYDVNNAINLYYTMYSSLGSFASLPNNSPESNGVFVAYPYFDAYAYKSLVPHEFGHFFGLWHTFDGGSELVTRGPEKNCETSGDFICDTPADPYPSGFCFRRLDSVTGECHVGCSGTDARGDTYNPDFSNIMSYFNGMACTTDFHFTPGQYLRMKIGLQQRLRETCVGTKRYSVTGTLPDTYILSDSLYDPTGVQAINNPLMLCRNATLLTLFTPFGAFQADNQFKVSIWTSEKDYLIREITDVPVAVVAGKPHTLAFTIPEQLKENTVYQIQVMSTNPSLSGCLNRKIINITSTPTVQLSVATTATGSVTIGFGEAVPLRVTGDGEGYQKVTLRINEQLMTFFEAGVTSWKQVETDYQTPVRFFKTSTVQINNANVPCGAANLSGELTVVVRPPVLKTLLPTGFSACSGQTVAVPFQSDVPLDFIAGNYQLQLSDQNGQFANDSTQIIGQTRTGSIQAVLPLTLPAGSGYRTRLVIRTSQGRVTGEPGESLTIRPKPQATLESGQQSIYVADSTRLTVAFTGEPPWSYTLSSGQSLTASQSPATIVVKPTQTTDYRVTAVQNACGIGSTSGLATVTVLQPLGPNPVYSGNLTLRLWPNPTGNNVFIEWADQPGRTVNLVLTNLNGQVLHSRTVIGTGLPEQQEMSLSTLPAGLYTISASDGHTRKTVQLINR